MARACPLYDDIEILKKLDTQGKQFTAGYQHHVEMLLPKLIPCVLSYSEFDTEVWYNYLTCLKAASNCSVKYILRYHHVLKKIVTLLPVMTIKSKTAIENAISPVVTIPDMTTEALNIYAIMRILYNCAIGSLQNTDLWNYITRDLDFKSITRKGGNHLKSFRPLFELCNDLCIVLKGIHDCHIDGADVQFVRKGRKEFAEQVASVDDPVRRQQMTTILKNKLRDYSVFCSSPSCGKQDPTSSSFAKCGHCHLTRYCSKTCQKQHWLKTGHKESCIKAPNIAQVD